MTDYLMILCLLALKAPVFIRVDSLIAEAVTIRKKVIDERRHWLMATLVADFLYIVDKYMVHDMNAQIDERVGRFILLMFVVFIGMFLLWHFHTKVENDRASTGLPDEQKQDSMYVAPLLAPPIPAPTFWNALVVLILVCEMVLALAK